MPTAENTEPAGGRVTRSLRKRLTSIDSDMSSRPGTPVNINLQTIPETNTPKKRVTRRASLSNTPSAMTPSKEITNTPGRRLTRRSSVNFSETEEPPTQIISKPTVAVVKEEAIETPSKRVTNTPGRRINRRNSITFSDSEDQSTTQSTIAKPTIGVVKEEETEVESPKEKPKRVLRSSSKSPNDKESTKKNKKTPKRGGGVNQEKQDADEIIVLDDSIEVEPLKSATKKKRASLKKENSIGNLEKEKSFSENEPTTPTKKSPRLSTTAKNSNRKSLSKTPSPKGKKRSEDADIDSPVKSASKRDSIIKQNTPEEPKSGKGSGRKSRSAQKEKQPSSAKSSPQTETSRKTPNKRLSNSTGESSGPRRLSLSDKNQPSPARPQSAKNSPAKKNLPEPLKNVAFNEEADENTVKNVYPKTPGLVKSKSYILDGSSDHEVDKDETFKSKKDQTFEDNETKSGNEEEALAALDTKTPYKLKLKAVESSTPIQSSPLKQNKTSEIQEQKEKSMKDEQKEKEKEETAFPRSWSKSVSGSANTSKIDYIAPEKQIQEAINQSLNRSANNSSKNKKQTYDPDISEAEDDLLEYDEDEDDEDEEEGNQNAEKTIFLDDEAMEVPEGEESMDSDEREYLDQNEVPEYGESIGSQDSEDDECEAEEEPDEEDAAFVVSDTEGVEELLSSEDEVEKQLNSKQKSYKRIYQESQSSEDEKEKEPTPTKDDTDFCLLVDSSAEVGDNKSINKSLKNDTDVKNKSARDKSLKEVSGNVEKNVEAEETDKNVSRKSLNKSKIDVEDNPSKNNSLDEESKAANSSKLNLVDNNNDSNAEMQEVDECLASTQDNPETSEIDAEGKEQDLEKSSETKKLFKSPKRLTKSPKRKSISTEDSACEADFELINDKSINKSRKSIDASAIEETSFSNKSLRKSTIESPSKSFKKLSTVSGGDSSDDEQELLKSPRTKRLTKSSPKRKSITPSVPDENQSNTSINTRKSLSRSISTSENEEARNVSQRKSVDNSESLNNSKSRKSLNESRKSLKRTSTEESNGNEDQSTIEKTKLSIDEGSEPEETLSASETPLDSSGRTLNSSKKLRKSMDSRNSSILNESTGDPQKSKRRRSMAQESIIKKAQENSSDSEEENEAHQKPTEQSNELNKSNRRNSVPRHSITQKTVENPVDSEEKENEEKSSPEITENEMYSSHGEEVEAEFSDEEIPAENKANESSSRRKSIAQNESKLDETFQLDPKSSLSSSLHDTLHRSVLRKSMNQSQKEKIEDNDPIPSDSEDEHNSSEEEEEEVNMNQKIVLEKGLSVSLNSIQIKKKKLKDDAKAIRNSFTIGVSVRKNSSSDEESSPEGESIAAKKKHQLEENDDHSDDHNSSSSEGKLLNVSEENVLEKVKDVQQVGSYKPRKSMSSSIVRASSPDADTKQKKKIKRTSLYLQEESASNSFVENLAEEKKKIGEKKRKSNSFCGVIAPSADEDADPEILVKEPRSEKKLKKSYETEDKDDDVNEEENNLPEPKSDKKIKKSFEPEANEGNVQHVLSRCEQMIEAANEAKRKAKLEAKKVKVKKPKWMDKEEKATKEEEKVEIPLISKKEIKRKEKMKKELAKALKQSASVLSKAVHPLPKVRQPKVEENNVNPSKRLETEFLESLMELSNNTKKKTTAIETTPPSDKENSKKKSNKQKYKVENIQKKLKSDIETLETACGTVIVEPSTPQKLRYQNGFRESPKTPVGFKIQDLSSKKSDKKTSRKLKTTLGAAFVEEDLNNDSKVLNLNKRKNRKRKLQIEEPKHILPKTQWTPSGVFVEEDLPFARPLTNSTATQFLVAPLSSGKKNKPADVVISSSTLNKALSFKNSASKNKGNRQKSREILHVKQRKIVNDRF